MKLEVQSFSTIDLASAYNQVEVNLMEASQGITGTGMLVVCGAKSVRKCSTVSRQP